MVIPRVRYSWGRPPPGVKKKKNTLIYIYIYHGVELVSALVIYIIYIYIYIYIYITFIRFIGFTLPKRFRFRIRYG